MEFLRWFAGSGAVPRLEHDLLWGWGTLVLSGTLVSGYALIAFNWSLQRRTLDRAESARAARRLIWLLVACLGCAAAFFVLDTPWIVWRGYDGALLALNVYTWAYVFRMRGLSLLDKQRAAMRELQQSVEKYRVMSDYLPHMVWTATADGSVDFSNLRWVEYVGGRRTWPEVVHPDDRQVAMESWEAAVRDHKPVRVEVRLGGLGGYRTFLLTATPLLHGQTVRWLGACVDVEDQKQLATERERQARQRAFMLNALGHDLRAPLNAVVLNAELLKMSSRDADVSATASAIAESAHAAGALVTRLLEYARVGARDDNELSQFSLDSVLAQLERRFVPMAERKGLRLRVKSADLELYTDRMKLERILNNLLDNALKFTDSGVILLEAFRERDDTAVIQVSDTGVGVPEQHVPFLFNEFYQVNNHERDQTKGFGMGLAICRCLARQLGGDVRLARTGPGGSTFRLELRGIDSRGGRRPAGEGSLVPDSQDATVCGP